MPMTIDQNLVPAAIMEFAAAKEHDLDDGEAWILAVRRVRYDVLQMAALTCEEQGRRCVPDSIEASASHACADAIRALF